MPRSRKPESLRWRPRTPRSCTTRTSFSAKSKIFRHENDRYRFQSAGDAHGEAEREKVARAAIIRVARDQALTPAERIVTIVGMNLASAFSPDSTPVHVRLGDVAECTGMKREDIGLALKAAHYRGHVTRSVFTLPPGPQGGRPTTEIYLSGGDGTVRDADYLEPSKEKDKARHAKKREQRREQQQTTESALTEQIAVLEEVAEIAKLGCPACRGQLLGTGYACESCGTPFTVDQIMVAPDPGARGLFTESVKNLPTNKDLISTTESVKNHDSGMASCNHPAKGVVP